MLFVVAVTHDLQKQRIAVRPSHIIRRARILASHSGIAPPTHERAGDLIKVATYRAEFRNRMPQHQQNIE
jgi:hypothetical protein